jgi:hypothetical protein
VWKPQTAAKIQQIKAIALLVESLVTGQGSVPLLPLVIRRLASIVVKSDIWRKNVKVQKSSAATVDVIVIVIVTMTTIDVVMIDTGEILLIVDEMILEALRELLTMMTPVVLLRLLQAIEMTIHDVTNLIQTDTVEVMAVEVVPGLLLLRLLLLLLAMAAVPPVPVLVHLLLHIVVEALYAVLLEAIQVEAQVQDVVLIQKTLVLIVQ